jgi:hypothetical protein
MRSLLLCWMFNKFISLVRVSINLLEAWVGDGLREEAPWLRSYRPNMYPWSQYMGFPHTSQAPIKSKVGGMIHVWGVYAR